MAGDITVLKIRRVNGDTPLKAFVDLQIGAWTILDWRIIKQNGQRAWISPPQASWKGQDGETHYKALISIPGELKQRIDAAILSAWEKENGDGQHS